MREPRQREPVVVEPVVNREKFRELLALETEYSTLDQRDRHGALAVSLQTHRGDPIRLKGQPRYPVGRLV
jgi:hypothetical protein